MQAKCILAPHRKKIELEVKEKKVLKNILTQDQIGEVENGELVATLSTGKKLKLEDEVKGTVLMLSPLCGG
jgi:hypothetical protein